MIRIAVILKLTFVYERFHWNARIRDMQLAYKHRKRGDYQEGRGEDDGVQSFD